MPALVIEPLAGRTGFRVAGDLDFGTHAQLAAALDAAGAAIGDIHLDLAELGFIDVGGVTLLATRARRLGPRRRLVLYDPPEQLMKIIELMWGDRAAIEVISR